MQDAEKIISEKYSMENIDAASLFEQLPLNIFFKDTQARYQLSSHICNMISGGDENFSLRGKTDFDIQADQGLARKFYDEDMEIIKTGGEIKYLQPMTFDDRTFYYEIYKKAVLDKNGRIIGVLGVINDMTELVVAGNKLKRISSEDAMTGLYNRSYFEISKEELDALPKPVSVICADCDRLKYVNDTFGHGAGDAYIQKAAALLKTCAGEDGFAIRMGGDEFLIICPETDENACMRRLKKLNDDIARTVVGDVNLSVSYGYDVICDSSRKIEDAIKTADERMYECKLQNHAKSDR